VAGSSEILGLWRDYTTWEMASRTTVPRPESVCHFGTEAEDGLSPSLGGNHGKGLVGNEDPGRLVARGKDIDVDDPLDGSWRNLEVEVEAYLAAMDR
jgi:hypothetical protein